MWQLPSCSRAFEAVRPFEACSCWVSGEVLAQMLVQFVLLLSSVFIRGFGIPSLVTGLDMEFTGLHSAFQLNNQPR